MHLNGFFYRGLALFFPNNNLEGCCGCSGCNFSSGALERLQLMTQTFRILEEYE